MINDTHQLYNDEHLTHIHVRQMLKTKTVNAKRAPMNIRTLVQAIWKDTRMVVIFM